MLVTIGDYQFEASDVTIDLSDGTGGTTVVVVIPRDAPDHDEATEELLLEEKPTYKSFFRDGDAPLATGIDQLSHKPRSGSADRPRQAPSSYG